MFSVKGMMGQIKTYLLLLPGRTAQVSPVAMYISGSSPLYPSSLSMFLFVTGSHTDEASEV